MLPCLYLSMLPSSISRCSHYSFTQCFQFFFSQCSRPSLCERSNLILSIMPCPFSQCPLPRSISAPLLPVLPYPSLSAPPPFLLSVLSLPFSQLSIPLFSSSPFPLPSLLLPLLSVHASLSTFSRCFPSPSLSALLPLLLVLCSPYHSLIACFNSCIHELLPGQCSCIAADVLFRGLFPPFLLSKHFIRLVIPS
jgi:hypothetical protein